MNTMPDGRPVPPPHADERTMLESWLDFHRATLALKCRGLDDEQIRTASVPPSSMTLLGLVRHLEGVERHWFQEVFAGEAVDLGDLVRRDGGFALDAEEGDSARTGTGEAGGPGARGGITEALDAWRATVDRNRALSAAAPLDAPGRLTAAEAAMAGSDTVSLRWILVHMIEEYARHNGHADLIRERIDGVTGP
ncbi:DinB family protein [Streptomyces sp. NPDC088745]|uniref:DinB family protein n=1 Tax=Streptomyces sp. NPDC088745 TaxID=3365884 RepID=UPI0037F7ED8B